MEVSLNHPRRTSDDERDVKSEDIKRCCVYGDPEEDEHKCTTCVNCKAALPNHPECRPAVCSECTEEAQPDFLVRAAVTRCDHYEEAALLNA